jgi:hypothetical protein
VLKTWAKYGTGEPLTEEKLAHMLKVLNEPLTPAQRQPTTLCGRQPYSLASIDNRFAFGSIESV